MAEALARRAPATTRPPLASASATARRRGQRLLQAAALLLPVAPLVRTFVGPIPLYLSDPLLAALGLRVAGSAHLPARQRRVLGWGLAFVATTIPSVLVAFLVWNQPAFTTYYWARRVLALSAFPTFLVIFTCLPSLRRDALRLLALGLAVTAAWCVAQVISRSTGPVGWIDRFYYDVLARAVLESSISRWAASWKTVRAIGGWWNANTAGAALVLGLAMLPALPVRRGVLVTTALAWLALLGTASRQALIGAALVTAIVVAGDLAGRARRPRGRTLLAFAGAIGFAFALLIAGDQLARLLGGVEGGLGEGVTARWNNYPEAFATLRDSPIWALVLGHGAEGWTVAGRTGAPDTTAFVSNTLVLVLLENGVVACAALIGFVGAVFAAARAPWQRAIVVLVVWLMNCDNHLYLFPGLMALAAIALALAAAPPALGPTRGSRA